MPAGVVVAGSINMDLVATAQAIPRPGETLAGKTFARFPGGKGANQAVAAAKLGAPTTLLGCLGRDSFAAELRAHLAENDVRVQVAEVDAPTGTAMIVVDEVGENSIVVIPGANARLHAGMLAEVPIHRGDVLVAQLEVPVDTVAAFFERGRAAGAVTMLNAAPAVPDAELLLPLADILVVNEIELAIFSGMAASSREQQVEAALACRRFREQVVVVTRGREGSIAIDADQVIDHPGHAVTAVDTTGAGDCFVGALAARLCAGDPLAAGLAYANSAASICVQRPGAGPSMPTAAEIQPDLASYETGEPT
ncbi:MAG: ribokinase [Gammaproteobacteria bacterium]|nr:ribokinase [Gammaproteobacteria bacterium]